MIRLTKKFARDSNLCFKPVRLGIWMFFEVITNLETWLALISKGTDMYGMILASHLPISLHIFINATGYL